MLTHKFYSCIFFCGLREHICNNNIWFCVSLRFSQGIRMHAYPVPVEFDFLAAFCKDSVAVTL